jgi:uncharacterized protein YggE
MYRRFRGAFVALLPAVAATLGAQQPAPSGQGAPPPAITATGQGEVRIPADRATIVVAVETHGASAAAAAGENARRVKAALDTLRALGFGHDQLMTAGYAVTPDYRYDKPGVPHIDGYTARNSIRIDVRKLEQLGPVIDAALAGGANTIGDVDFSASNVDEARHTALAAAVQKAQGDAEAMARAAGGALGPLLELSSAQSEGGIRPMFAMRAMAAPAPSVPTSIEAGDITLSVSVTARWEFVERR